MQKPNTKKHWTALAVARYYDRFGTACRVRDLYPYVESIHDSPDSLAATLHPLKAEDTIGYIVVETKDDNSTSKAFAYYPTPITIEDLLDIGEPTELPDGEPVPDGVDTSIPRSRVSAGDDVEPPAENPPAPEYNSTIKRRGGDLPARDYDSSDIQRDPDATVDTRQEVADDADDEDADDAEYVCEDCGEGFDDDVAYAAHRRWCDHDAAEDSSESPDEHVCEDCGKEFDSGPQLGGHRRACPERDTDPIECVCGRTFESQAGYAGHQRSCPGPQDDESDDTEAVEDSLPEYESEMVAFDADTTSDPIGDIEREPGPAPVAGSNAGAVEWSRIATRLERKAMDADDAGLTEIASAYSQMAALAVEGDLDKRTAYILLGTPVLELEDEATLKA